MKNAARFLCLLFFALCGCSTSVRSLYDPSTDSVSVPIAKSSTAMVVSAHPIASRNGIDVLRAGGNAADAAIAALSTLNVVEPHASGLGGGGFVLYYDAKRDSFCVIDYREKTPGNALKQNYYRKDDTLQMTRQHGATAIGTPGSPAGWQALFDNFCTQPLAGLLEPAAIAAETGFSLSEKQVAIIMDHLPDMMPDSSICAIFLDGGLPPETGFVVKQPQLASTLRTLGHSSFTRLYHPPFASDIVDAVQARGGVLNVNDLETYSVQFRTPLRGSYNGYEIITLPPPSIGGTALLEILKCAEKNNLRSMPFLSAEYVHCLAQASRQALKDVTTSISDPEYYEQPVGQLLSDEWIEKISEQTTTVSEEILPWEKVRMNKAGNTTHLVIADSLGNLVSLTQSINDFYGAGVMAPASGILLNNHLADFSGDTTRNNSVTPYHRPTSNMAATIVRKNGKPVLVIGSPGGQRIAPTVAHVIISILDGRATLQDAIKAPRFFPQNSTLVVETRMPQETIDGLNAKGWKIRMNGSLNNFFGGVHAIQIDPQTHEMTGAADPRRDGMPAPW